MCGLWILPESMSQVFVVLTLVDVHASSASNVPLCQRFVLGKQPPGVISHVQDVVELFLSSQSAGSGWRRWSFSAHVPGHGV